jgi:DNA replication initiation complex subunit (GINS family)
LHSELYKAWKSEKTSELPQPLPSDFYGRATAYLSGLEDQRTSGNAHALQDRLTVREKEIAERLLAEIKQARLRKISSSSLEGRSINPQNLTDEEKTLLESLQTSREKLIRVQTLIEPPSSSPKAELTIVRFLQDIPEIVGVDLRMYGPYKKEDVGSIPIQNAHALIRQGAVRAIDVK